MLLDPGQFLLLLALGGWVAVDATSLGQFMVSRPLVAATLAGWIAGDPVQGAMIGVVLEIFQLAVLPVGAARYPEAGPAAVVAGSVYAAGEPSAAGALVAIAFALLWESLSGESVRRLRQVNVRVASVAEHAMLSARELERRHFGALLLDFARGALLVGVGVLVLSALERIPLRAVPMEERGAALVMTVAMAGLLAGVLRLFSGRTGLFLAGAVAGLLFLLVRP